MRKPVAWIFEQVAEKAARPVEILGKYDRIIHGAICDALEAAGEEATLLRNEDSAERGIAAHALRSAVSHVLRYGVLDPVDWRLRGLRDWHGAEVLVSDEVAKRAVRAALPATAGGRPMHPAFSAYQSLGFERGGRTIKQLQAELPNDENGAPPSPTTIREWEKKYRRKPPTETLK